MCYTALALFQRAATGYLRNLTLGVARVPELRLSGLDWGQSIWNHERTLTPHLSRRGHTPPDDPSHRPVPGAGRAARQTEDGADCSQPQPEGRDRTHWGIAIGFAVLAGSLGGLGSRAKWGYTSGYWQLAICQPPGQGDSNDATNDPHGLADTSTISHPPANSYIHAGDSTTGRNTYLTPISGANSVSQPVTTSAHSHTGDTHSHATAHSHVLAAAQQHAPTITHTLGHPLIG